MKTFYLTLLCLLSILRTNAQFDAYLDSSFSDDGIDIFSTEGEIHKILLAPDGKIILAGSGNKQHFIRLNDDGSLDPSFNGTGSLDTGRSMSVQKDYLTSAVLDDAGRITGLGGIISPYLIRILRDGTIDTSFGNSNGWEMGLLPWSDDDDYYFFLSDLALQSTGKIIVTGTNSTPLAGESLILGRLNTDGSPDSTFAANGIATVYDGYCNQGNTVIVQPDDKIIVGGVYTGAGYYACVRRFTPNGKPDSSFNTTGEFTNISGEYGTVNSLALQPDEKIICAGYYGSFHAMLFRLNNNGTIDSSFGTDGYFFPAIEEKCLIQSVKIDDNENIVATGHIISADETSDLLTMRITPAGLPDESFGLGGIIITSLSSYNDRALDLQIQPGGKIIVGGTSSAPAFNQFGNLAAVRYFNDLDLQNIDAEFQTTNIIVYANPVQDNSLHIKYCLLQDEYISMQILNSSGQLVENVYDHSLLKMGVHDETISLSETLPAGYYLLSITTPHSSVSVQFVKAFG